MCFSRLDWCVAGCLFCFLFVADCFCVCRLPETKHYSTHTVPETRSWPIYRLYPNHPKLFSPRSSPHHQHLACLSFHVWRGLCLDSGKAHELCWAWKLNWYLAPASSVKVLERVYTFAVALLFYCMCSVIIVIIVIVFSWCITSKNKLTKQRWPKKQQANKTNKQNHKNNNDKPNQTNKRTKTKIMFRVS